MTAVQCRWNTAEHRAMSASAPWAASVRSGRLDGMRRRLWEGKSTIYRNNKEFIFKDLKMEKKTINTELNQQCK